MLEGNFHIITIMDVLVTGNAATENMVDLIQPRKKQSCVCMSFVAKYSETMFSKTNIAKRIKVAQI